MIYIGSDHAGFLMKDKIKSFMDKKNIQYEDIGTDTERSCDYPDIANKLCEKVKDNDKGILICGTGIGMSIAANRHSHIRAGLCLNIKQASLSRKHNNANVLVLQGRNKCHLKNINILKTFLKTDFEGGRHQRRIDKLK